MQSIFLISMICAFAAGSQFNFLIGDNDCLTITPSPLARRIFYSTISLAQSLATRALSWVQGHMPDVFAWVKAAIAQLDLEPEPQSLDRLEVNGRDLGEIGPVNVVTRPRGFMHPTEGYQTKGVE